MNAAFLMPNAPHAFGSASVICNPWTRSSVSHREYASIGTISMPSLDEPAYAPTLRKLWDNRLACQMTPPPARGGCRGRGRYLIGKIRSIQIRTPAGNMEIAKLTAHDVISLVVPFFNEEEVIEQFFGEVGAALDVIPNCDYEIVCVNDGSRDSTLEKLLHFSNIDPRVKVVDLSRNFGKEAALTAGLDHATGDAVIPFDADLQDPPSAIASLVEKWREGFDVVIAKRSERLTDSYLKRSTASWFYRVHNAISDIQIPANAGDFRLMSRQAVDALKQLPENRRFMKGLFAWVGFRTTTIEYVRHSRIAGESKFSGWKLWNFALEGVTSFSTFPLRVWAYLGGATATFALIYAVYLAVRTVVRGVDVPGYASIITAVLFLGGIQLIGIGIIGEYVGRIYYESKRRPNYLVRRVYQSKSSIE
jgi:glycosyltransferase involved in cell wall biosynthesis